MRIDLHKARITLILLIQLGLIAGSYILSFALRFDLDYRLVPFELVLRTLPLLLVTRMSSLIIFRMQRGLWRYVSIVDLFQIIKATSLSSLAFVLLMFFIFGFSGFPRSVFILDWAGNIFLLSGIRLLVRLLRQNFGLRTTSVEVRGSNRARLLIVGAGDVGAALCAQALSSRGFRFIPVAFVDNNPSKIGSTIHGVPVVNSWERIPEVAEEFRIDNIVIAEPSATPEQMRNLVEQCQKSNLPFKVLPDTPDILDGTINFTRIREVDPGDLLGRPVANLDRQLISRFISGKRVLVTGGAGSVGSELARQVSGLAPGKLMLIDRAENPLFFLEADLSVSFPDVDIQCRVGDVTDSMEMETLLAGYRPQVIFHAAAHKHVPLMERTPEEAVKNNIGGTLTMARLARQQEVETFILVSTDKAVNPTSVMGATKRVAELLLKDIGSEGVTKFMAVRFGNVLGSNGSVVPIFKRQIASGGPVTVTHPEALRYFMSISEAAGLILQAGAIGSGGETFVLDMGEPVSITSLAIMLITLSGLRPHEDIDIVYTGLRPGEKLSEELYFDGEEFEETGYEKLLVLKDAASYSGIVSSAEKLLHEVLSFEASRIKSVLVELVPEFTPGDLAEAQGPERK